MPKTATPPKSWRKPVKFKDLPPKERRKRIAAFAREVQAGFTGRDCGAVDLLIQMSRAE